jgi:protein-S-isoprenylcysteine O-methyltransferase Ste14
MVAAPRPTEPPAPTPSSNHATATPRWLNRVPLPVRMTVYGAAFLAAVLVGLPWLAYRVDVQWPAWRVELGPLRWVGVAFFVACAAVYGYSAWVLSSRGRGAYVEFDPPQAFVATGPFRWSRNPIAGSLVGMLLGEALSLSSTGIFLLFLLALPLAHLQVVWLEEPLLRRRFGDAYAEYLRRVPRWLPRPPREPGP